MIPEGEREIQSINLISQEGNRSESALKIPGGVVAVERENAHMTKDRREDKTLSIKKSGRKIEGGKRRSGRIQEKLAFFLGRGAFSYIPKKERTRSPSTASRGGERQTRK